MSNINPMRPAFVLALVATAWWLMRRDRLVWAGIALAFATTLKPQVVIMVPVCLLAAGRLKPLVSYAASGVVIAAVSALSLGPSGLNDFWQTLKWIQTDGGHSFFTMAFLFGMGPLTYALLAAQGAACVFVTWRRRDDLDVVPAPMVVRRVRLLLSLRAGSHPPKELARPVVHRAVVGRRPRARRTQESYVIRDR